MSVAATGALRKLVRTSWFVTGLLAAAAFLLLYTVRSAGWLEPLELLAYDHYLRAEAIKHPTDPRIVLVGASDEDLNRWGWPLTDELLAQALEKLQAQQPAAIGIDLYRDAPRGEGQDNFKRVMGAHPNIIAVTKIGGGSEAGVPPPPFADPQQVGFADVPLDRGDLVRRALLFLDDGQASYTGFALRLALLYLRPLGIALEAGSPDPSHLKLGKHTIPPFEADDGGYADADAGGYQFLLDFAGGPTPFRRLSLTELLTGRVPAEALRGSVVILGVAGQSVKDFFATPFSNSEYADQTVYGIAVHGHAVSQLLRIAVDGEAPIRVWGGGYETAWMALWCLLGGMMSLALRNPYRFGLGLCLGWGAIYAAGRLAMAGHLWLPVVPPALAWGTTSLFTLAYLSVMERKQRGQLMQIFERYVSREVAGEIWNHHEEFFVGGGRPVPQRLDVTILFSDIRGFTTISERLSAEALMTWLNMYTEAMADLVISHKGMVDKFIGDAVMAVFGAPLPRRGEAEIAADAVRAVECALAMGEEVRRLNGLWQAQGLPPIAIRIGINSGTVVAGSLGSKNRLEYTVIGDAVNIASRLESMDKDWPGLAAGEHCRILVSESTLKHLGERYETTSMGAVHLKGKGQEVRVVRIIARRQPA